MIRTQFGDRPTFTVHSDDAPNVYITGNPGRTDPRCAEPRAGVGAAALAEPVHRRRRSNIMVALADRTEMKTLHMVTAGPEPHADVHAVRRSRLVLLRDGRPDLRDASGRAPRSRRGPARASPGTTATSRTRSPRPGPATSGPASSTSATTRRLDRPHRPPADDADAARPAGRLPDRRSRAVARSRRERAAGSLRGIIRASSSSATVYKQLMASFGSFSMYTLVASTKALVERLGRRRRRTTRSKTDRR